jgi:hypothetical protein
MKLLQVSRRNHINVVSKRQVGEKNMGDNEPVVNRLCRYCGCSQPQAAADAQALGFEEEFASGIYNCCQVVRWADEQWLAWLNAGEQDGKIAEDVTRRLEISEPSKEFVYVRSRKHSGL